MGKIRLDLHDIFSNARAIEAELNRVIKEALDKRISLVEIIPGKGSGQLKKHVLRFLNQPEIKKLYHRLEKDDKNFGRVFVHFKFVIIFAVLQFLLVNLAFACSCMMPESPQVEFSKFDAVFIGQVINIEPAEKYGYSVKLKVLKRYKGSLDEFVTLHTGSGGGDCGYPFEENEEYFVYAYAYSDGFGVSICSRTKKLSEAQEDKEALDAVYNADDFIEIKTETIDGIIVPKYMAGNFYYRGAEDYFTPSREDVLQAESKVIGYIKDNSPQMRGYPFDPDLSQGLANYKRQYVGVILKAKRKIWLNFFCNTDIYDWKREPYVVFGGGACYFNLLYDVASGEFSDLWINGLNSGKRRERR